MRGRVARRPAHRVGVDVGGTFTDLVALDEITGQLHLLKTPTTPRDQSEAVAQGLKDLLVAAGATPKSVTYLGHGTTVCINAVLQRAGCRAALLTTRGMRDLLELRRQTRPSLYDLQADTPEPVIPRAWRCELPERMRADGAVIEPLDVAATRAVVEYLVGEGVEAIAVCLLHAYINPAHEQMVRAVIEDVAPHLFVSVSSEVLAEFREFERLSTTVLNAYVGPVMSRYLSRLEEQVARLGVTVPPFIVQSNGGVATVAHVRDRSVFTMASGPSAGVAGATFVSSAAGHDRIITFDMGGTSTDVCVVAGGAPLTAGQKDYDGYPVKGTMLDIDSVGAGGGSIAWVDPGGFVRVGPASAGADPGPACYGRGGTLPTVSDANLVLGRLGGDAVLGGTTRLDAKAARTAIERHLVAALGDDVEDAALRVLTVVHANMASAIRLATVERGLDPRGFTLVAYGGAGPMHAAAVASALHIPRVLVPARPGVLCALGLLVADVRSEFSQTAVRRAEATSAADVEEIFGRLEAQASAWAGSGGFRPEALRLLRTVDMRYRRQNHELSVPAGRSTPIAELQTRFHRAHRAMFGHDAAAEPTELVTFRVAAIIAVRRPRLAVPPRGGRLRARTRRPVRFQGRGVVECPVYERDALPIGARFPGPAIVEQTDCTTVVEPGQRVHVDERGNLSLTIGVTGRRT